MNRTERLNNAVEFCERNNTSEECRQFAQTCPRFYDFWENCTRGDWMLDLLDATNYRNYMDVWKVLEIVKTHQKRAKGITDLEQWRESFYQKIRERVETMAEDERKGSAPPGYARFAEWCSAYVFTDCYLQEDVRDAMFDAGFTAGIEAGLQGNNREDSTRISLESRREAFRTTREKQAHLLREVLGNPFDGSHAEDFEEGIISNE